VNYKEIDIIFFYKSAMMGLGMSWPATQCVLGFFPGG